MGFLEEINRDGEYKFQRQTLLTLDIPRLVTWFWKTLRLSSGFHASVTKQTHDTSRNRELGSSAVREVSPIGGLKWSTCFVKLFPFSFSLSLTIDEAQACRMTAESNKDVNSQFNTLISESILDLKPADEGIASPTHVLWLVTQYSPILPPSPLRAAGTRDKPLRTSAWEATEATASRQMAKIKRIKRDPVPQLYKKVTRTGLKPTRLSLHNYLYQQPCPHL